MTGRMLKEYITPQMDVVTLACQNLLSVSGILDEGDPIGPARAREFEDLEDMLLLESFLEV